MQNTTPYTNMSSASPLAIIGSRNFTDYDLMRAKIQPLLEQLPGMKRVISGGAKGADSLSDTSKLSGRNSAGLRVLCVIKSSFSKRMWSLPFLSLNLKAPKMISAKPGQQASRCSFSSSKIATA